ncbi:MAG: hypothetical protein BA863_06590 [Desulfovibrio sp. S3730MH75]|nr:MAG: hypothetical protein BA863_06590 [Desulfovibrio sp. S3730MH75]
MDIKNMLRKLSRTGDTYENTALAFNAKGDVMDIYACSKSERIWHRTTTSAETKSPTSCIVVLPPGLAALRKSPVPKNNRKDAAAVLGAETERTLIRNPQLGCAETRMISLEQGIFGVTAWLPSELLYLCFEQSEAEGFAPKAVLLPEYNLASSAPALFISCMDKTVNIYFINEHTPLTWQSLPIGGPSIGAGIKAVLDEARELGEPQPQHVLVWDSSEVSESPAEAQLPDRAATAVGKLMPGTEIIRTEGMDGLLTHLRLRRESLLSRNKTAFRPSLNQWLNTPLNTKDILRLAIPVACAIFSCLLFFMAVVNLYNNEANALEKEASQLKILAARSDAATQRIRTLAEHRRDILRYTTDKPFVFSMFKNLNAAVPKEVKISNLKIGRSGEVNVSGDAINEVSLISFLTNLNTAENFNNAELASMSRQKLSKNVKFVIIFEYTPWKEFFRQESEAEK